MFTDITLDNVPGWLESHRDELENRLATAFRAFLISRVERGMANVTPLKPSTVERKGSSIPLIETKEMLNSIVVRANRVGMLDGVHKPSGMSYDALASLHEYGRLDLNIPARPAWSNLMEAFYEEGHAEKVIEDFLKTSLNL